MLAGVAVMTAFLSLAAVTAGADPRRVAPDPVLPGPYAVASMQVSIRNFATGAQLHTDIYYPAANGNTVAHPAIVFAPAFIAQPAYYANRGRHLGSRGYVVAIPRFPNEDLEVRAADIRHIFSYLEAENGAVGSPLFGRIDGQRFGLAGHSLGGVGTLMVAARDPRVKAAVALDPIDPPGVLGKISPSLARARGNLVAAGLSSVLHGHAWNLYSALADTGGAPTWDYTAEAPRIRIPVAVIGGQRGCTQFGAYANYSQMYPAIGSQQKALYVLPDGWHCDFMSTDSALTRNACYLVCGGSYSQERADLIERYLTAWFDYYLAGRGEYFSYLFGAEAAADVAAGRIISQSSTGSVRS